VKLTPEQRLKVEFERTYLHRLIQKYITILNSIPEKGNKIFCVTVREEFNTFIGVLHYFALAEVPN